MAITTGRVRASFVHIFQPNIPQNGGEPKYSITLLIPKGDMATLNGIYAEIEKAKQEGVQKFGGNIPPGCKTPIYDGDGVRPASGEPFGEECRGHMVMTASAKLQPSIVGLDMQNILNPAEVYSGCYVRANINFFAYNTNGNKGIGCGLNAVQKIADGEPLTARVSAEEAFGGANAYQAGQYQTQGQYMPQGQTSQPAYQPQAQTPQPMYQPQAQYQQGTYPMQPGAPQNNAQQIDPITGRPMLAGGIMGL